MATLQNFFQSLIDARATNAGVTAATVVDSTADPNAPDLDELQSASAERAAHAGSDLDDPEAEPTYEAARPSIDETHRILHREHGAGTRNLDAPIPVAATTFQVSADADQVVEVLPASGGRPRHTLLRHLSGADDVFVATDRNDVASSGMRIRSSVAAATLVELETWTQGPLYATSTAEFAICVLTEHYPAPTAGTCR